MTQSALGAITASPRRRRKLNKARIKEEIAGYIWTSPWWLGFLVFGVYPMLVGIYYAFTDARWVRQPNWVGLQNFVTALTGDALFWPSLGRTFYYALAVVPLGLSASLFAASLLNQRLKGENIFRTVFYLPTLMPSVALVVIWAWILNPTYGLLNQMLGVIGISGPGWLSSAQWAMPALVLMAIWGSFGGNAMLIFLSTLQSIPQDLYEVCDLDGGNSYHKFRYITVPMISPAILFNLIMGIIGAFNSFLYSFLAPTTPGGPNFATYTLGLHIYNKGFRDGLMGYAIALSWLLFVVVFVFMFLTYKGSGQWMFLRALEEEGEA